ncbi:MAG TPA: phage major capsid protein [Candidatus Eisenbacteria bacterium]|nr:phage major capsid protein [Candidatus Eisenbacteria bacterium]
MGHRIAVPVNSDELREQLTDRAIMRELMRDPETFADHMEASVNARLKRDPEIEGQTAMQTEKFMIEWLRNQQGQNDTDALAKRLNLDNPNARARIKPNTIYNKKAIGAAHDSLFASPSEFMYSISEHSSKDSSLSNSLITLKNSLSSVKPSDGGFLIPEVLRAELLRVALESAIVRARARVIPMDSLTVPFPMVDSTSNVSSVYGGVTGYWTEEGATLTESKPKFGRIELKANKLVLYCEVPNELIRDAQPALDAFINEIFPEAIAWFEDVAFFIGAGVGEPLGFLNAPAAISVTRAAGNQSIDWVDIASMYCRMLPQSINRAVWIVSPDAVANLLTMPFAATGTFPPVLIGTNTSGAGIDSPYPLTILGRPVIVSEKARALGTSGDINFVDFGFYLIGDRQAMSAKQSEDYRFQTDLTAFRVIERLDGRPWLQSPITPQNSSSNTLSPFVKLN